MNVLLIEDDADVTELLSACISSRWPEATVNGVMRGRQGLQLAQREPPDLVILDIGLPDIDGYQVLRQLRVFSDVPVVMLTGRGREEDVDAFLKEGAMADYYVVKPVNVADLVSRLEVVIGTPDGDTSHTTRDEPAGRSQRGEEHYEGTVRLRVWAEGNLSLLVSFVQQVYRSPDLRLLRMVNSAGGLVEMWLGIRQPIPLRIMLAGMEGVANISPRPSRNDEPLTLTLGTILCG